MKIIKRNGKLQEFDVNKLTTVVLKAFSDFPEIPQDEVEKCKTEIIDSVVALCEKLSITEELASVEDIQDQVCHKLRQLGYRKVANEFDKVRQQRALDRTLRGVMETLSNEDTEEKNDNGNVNGWTASGRHLHISEDIIKLHAKTKIFSKDVVEAVNNGTIYVHDMGWTGTGSLTCVQIDLEKLLKGGFSTGHGYLREPSNIKTAYLQAAIAVQSNQNDQHGGQSVPNLDRALAPYVLKTYKKHLKKLLKYESTKEHIPLDDERIEEALANINSIEDMLRDNVFISRMAYDYTWEDCLQGAESIVHNLNSMASRAGSQVPFSSLNFGLDTTPEGRFVTKSLLMAQMSGLGRHETPIFPILIFILKKGINFEKGDPNYDLFRLAMECSSKRLFPTYSFVDSSFNLPYYEADPYYGAIQTMGCRTRVMANVNGREGAYSRGNLSFTSINLPMLALNAKGNIDKFYKELDKAMALCDKALLQRLEVQSSMRKYNFPSLMGQGIWLDSDNLKETDEVREVLKHGSLSIGFVGLAECLKCLVGKHHGESEEADKLGYEIISYIRAYCDRRAKEESKNFTCLGTPAETYCKTALNQARAKHGIVEGVTDREYFTNSSHVPVYHPITIAEKAKIEGKYHKLENAGHIFYCEVDGDISQNIDAFEQILHIMSDNDIGYGAVNIPICEDPVCGHSWRGIDTVCPFCGRDENEEIDF